MEHEPLPFIDLDDQEIQQELPLTLHKASTLRVKQTTAEFDLLQSLPFFHHHNVEPPEPTISRRYMEDVFRDCEIHFSFNFVKSTLMRNLREAQVIRLRGPLSKEEPPLEIMLEIFLYLHPLDLFHFTHVSRKYRMLLLGPSRLIKGLWAHIFDNDDSGIPEAPADMCPVVWALFLFGSTLCWDCKKVYGAPPDFLTMRRLCYSCFSSTYAYPSTFGINPTWMRADGFWIQQHPLYAILPRTCWFDDWISHDQDDCEIDDRLVNKKTAKSLLEDLHEDPYMTTSDFEDEFEEVKKLLESRTDWLVGLFNEYEEKKQRDRRDFLRRIRLKLYKQGFTRDELKGFGSDLIVEWNCWGVLRVTNRFIKRAWPAILSVAERSRSTYQLYTLRKEISKRKNLIREAYRAYRANHKAQTWHTFPSDDEVLEMVPCAALVEKPTGYIVTLLECQAAISQASEAISNWYSTRREIIFAQFADTQSTLSNEEQFDLATSIFICAACHPREEESGRIYAEGFGPDPDGCGWHADDGPDEYDSDVEGDDDVEAEKSGESTELAFDVSDHPVRKLVGSCLIAGEAIWKHVNCGFLFRRKKQLVPFHPGSRFVAHLLETLGLPKNAAALTLDVINPYIACWNCIFPQHVDPMKAKCRRVLSWREYVKHLAVTGENHLRWTLVSEAVAGYVRYRSAKDATPAPVWACNYCPEHLDVCVTQLDAVEHVRTIHQTEASTKGGPSTQLVSAGSDIIHCPGYIDHTKKGGILVPLHRSGNHVCLLCDSLEGVRRFFSKNSVEEHLGLSHDIERTQQTVHWEVVDVLSRPWQDTNMSLN